MNSEKQPGVMRYTNTLNCMGLKQLCRGYLGGWDGTVLPSQLLMRLRKEDHKFKQGLPSLWNQFQDRVGNLTRACLKMGVELMAGVGAGLCHS